MVKGDAAGSGPEPPFRSLAIVGVGLIGGSIGLAARARWPGIRVVGIDSRDTLAAALALGAVTEAAADPAATTADLVVLCAPPAANVGLLRELAPRLRPEAIVTDVGSTKRDIVRAADDLGFAAFAGGHPIAGAATSGVGSAREGLFRGRPWLFTPGTATGAGVVDRLEAFARALGASPATLDAAAHDRLLAYVSHLPQVVASVLLHTIGTAVGPDGLALSGPGLADTTRLASSPGTLWAGILGANADHVADALQAVEAALAAMRADLGRPEAIESIFTSAARWRRAIKLIGEADRAPSRPPPVAERSIPATRTYLEQTERPRLDVPWPDPAWTLTRLTSCPASFYRFLYREVGRPWHWIDRLPWTDERIRALLSAPGLEIWLLAHAGSPAGFAELARTADGGVEIVYFGLLPEFLGRRAGRPFLAAVVDRAWDGGATRITVNTCTLDHARALPNYLAGGFRVVREEHYEARLETPSPAG
jgi:prephenate dehydrogenase